VKVSQGRLKQNTRDDYERLLKRYVLGKFGAHAIAGITPRDCEQFLAGLVRQQSRQGAKARTGNALSPATVKHAWSVFRRVMTYALRHNAIQSNPTERVDFATNRATGDHEKFEHHPLTSKQVGELCGAIAGQIDGLPEYPVYALMVEFLAYSGLRASENAGLEVGDLAFTTAPAADPSTPATRCAVNVRRSKFRKDGKWVTATPKSRRSRRTVPMPSWLAEKLRIYLSETHPRADDPTAPLWPSRKNGGGYREKGARYAVPLDWSEALAMGSFYDTIMKPALEAIGLPATRPAITATETEPARPPQRGVRVHDLRHTFATMQLMAGTHFMQVSKWLGHGSFTLTLDTYGDWIPEEDGGAANTLPEPPTANQQEADLPPNVIRFAVRS
jgi:integrase